MIQEDNQELAERVQRKYSSWKKEHPFAGTVCVAHSDELDFFSTDASVSTILKEIQVYYGLNRDEALNYLDAAQFSDDSIY